MKIDTITIHNFRAIKDGQFKLMNSSLLVGANNSGKSTVFNAIRIFYEKVNYSVEDDFPKFPVSDNESWIDIQFVLTLDEQDNLKEEYKNHDGTFKVRKYFRSDNPENVQARQSNIFGYEHGVISKNHFYGAKNFSNSKFGDIVYIPEISTTDDALKLGGPSPLRDMVSFIMKKVVKNSEAFAELTKQFEEFEDKFRGEQSEGHSLYELSKDINANLEEWKIKFGININPIRIEDILKNLVSHDITDEAISEKVSIKNMGQGVQRHLIFTLLQLSSKYADKEEPKKKDFAPDFTLMLFEEPEAFLHPCQQEALNRSLQTFGSEKTQQVFITTHSPIFVSKNIDELPSIIKLRKNDKGIVSLFQLNEEIKNEIIEQNSQFVSYLKGLLDDPTVEKKVKDKIKSDYLTGNTDEKQMEEESIRYVLWLDANRCSAFFSDAVLICEGPTEKIFLDYLIENKWGDLADRKICILDAMGKYNIHRCMNLFGRLGIYHSVLYDKDEETAVHGYINRFVEQQKNSYTIKIDSFDSDIESFLGIPKPNRPDRKPLNVLWHYSTGRIKQEKIDELEKKVTAVISS